MSDNVLLPTWPMSGFIPVEQATYTGRSSRSQQKDATAGLPAYTGGLLLVGGFGEQQTALDGSWRRDHDPSLVWSQGLVFPDLEV